MARIHPRVDDRDADATPRQRPMRAGAGPDLIGTDRFVEDVRGRSIARVRREVIDRLVLLQRRQLTGGDAQHRAVLQLLPDAEVVTLRQRLDLFACAMHNDVDRRRTGPHVIRQIVAETRTMGSGRRDGAENQEGKSRQEGSAEAIQTG